MTLIQWKSPRAARQRGGKVLVFVAVSCSAILGILGLVFDAGLMTSDNQNLHHATDAAATAAAMDLLLGHSTAQATATATSYVTALNGLADAQTTVNIPPVQGPYAGQANYVEVIATRSYQTRIIQLLGSASQQTITTRSVANYQASTAGGVIDVLDPTPPALSVSGVPPVLPSYPAILGGLEVLGLGTVSVNGAVLVNTTWGGVDQNGNPAGTGAGPPYGISCTPLISLTHLNALNIRVSGGVDNQANYGNYKSGASSPLLANQLPVPDPFETLPVPSTASDPVNVNTTLRGSAQVISLPLGVPTVLQPGVYDWIEVDAGQAVFQPGIYIIRSTNPLTGLALNILAGTVTANGVMFYVTNSSSYNPQTGAPDSGDGDTRPAVSVPTSLTPSVVINAAIPGSTFLPLNTGSSPFDGILIYQRRSDASPVVVVHSSLLGAGTFSGTFYAKWGHVLFTGAGTYDIRIVSGTARLVTVTGMTIVPSVFLPPAKDVFLVE